MWAVISSCSFCFLSCRSESIAGAMVARGFGGPEGHTMYMTRINRPSLLANVVALGLLSAFVVISQQYR